MPFLQAFVQNNDSFINVSAIDHFTVVCSVTWPLNGSEVGVGLGLIQTSLGQLQPHLYS